MDLTQLISTGALKPPVDLVATYKGQELYARIGPDGNVAFGGQVYGSLSTAAGIARRTVLVGPDATSYTDSTGHTRSFPQTDGWTFWRTRLPDGSLVAMDHFRDGAKAQPTTYHAELGSDGLSMTRPAPKPSAKKRGRPTAERRAANRTRVAAEAAKGRAARRKVAAMDALPGPEHVKAVGSDEGQAALEAAAEASLASVEA